MSTKTIQSILAPSRRHQFIGAHPLPSRTRRLFQPLVRGIPLLRPSRTPDDNLLIDRHKFDLDPRRQSKPIPNRLGNRRLALGGDFSWEVIPRSS